MEDRAWWEAKRADPATSGIIDDILKKTESASAQPPVIAASDFLAAKRSNDRARLDEFWRTHRTVLGDLCVRRAVLGMDAQDNDDRLLDWLWSFLNQPTWVVSAHLPNRDLPAAGSAQLDLAATEMAAVMAETRELLLPWIIAQSGTLADSIIAEIDRRVIEPFVNGREDKGWARTDFDPNRNNWTGVCAGSILAACVSMERQGHPRPEARELAIHLIDIFLREGFTKSGECDEGVAYWGYGVGFMCNGLECLSVEELNNRIDMQRLKQVAGYPGRAHLFGQTFYAANDSGMRAGAATHFVPWLAAVTGDSFLQQWAAAHPAQMRRCVPTALRSIEYSPNASDADRKPLAANKTPRWLEDQQVVIATEDRMLVAIGGGNNAERHNHNDLGHFVVAVDEKIIIPDLGAPLYTADFFSSKRYTYLSASSRGHCCPIINGQEQRAGSEAQTVVLAKDLTPGVVAVEMDLTSAYPPAAKLKLWKRSMKQRDGGFVIGDRYELAGAGEVTQVVWFAIKPAVEKGGAITAGPLQCRLTPPPVEMKVVEVDPVEHHLRDFKAGQTLYRLEASYRANEKGVEIELMMRI